MNAPTNSISSRIGPGHSINPPPCIRPSRSEYTNAPPTPSERFVPRGDQTEINVNAEAPSRGEEPLSAAQRLCVRQSVRLYARGKVSVNTLPSPGVLST